MRQVVERRDALAGLGSAEPVTALASIPALASRRRGSNGRTAPVRPSERRRRARRLGLSFVDESIPERLRALARRWGMVAPDGRSAGVSAVVEYLLAAQLERAEAGEIDGPGERI